MSEQTGFVQEGFDRFNDAYRSVDEGVQRLQKEFKSRRKDAEKRIAAQRKSIEKQVTSSRKDFEKRTRKQVNSLKKNDAVKRAFALRDDANQKIESRMDDLLGLLNIASRSELKRLDKKIGQINRKLRGLESPQRSNGAAPPSG